MTTEDKIRTLLHLLPHKLRVRYSLNCANDCKHLLTDPRSLKALEITELWLKGEATDAKLRLAADAAFDASAAYASAYYASSSASAAYATYAAASAAYASAYYASSSSSSASAAYAAFDASAAYATYATSTAATYAATALNLPLEIYLVKLKEFISSNLTEVEIEYYNINEGL